MRQFNIFLNFSEEEALPLLFSPLIDKFGISFWQFKKWPRKYTHYNLTSVKQLINFYESFNLFYACEH